MKNRKTYEIEITTDEIHVIIFALEFCNNVNEDNMCINLIEELKELLKNGA